MTSSNEVVDLLEAGELVRIRLIEPDAIQSIAETMAGRLGRVRQVHADAPLTTCLWSIRRGDFCVPFVFFEEMGDFSLWQNFMLFDRYRSANPGTSLPALLIGERDVFGPELGGKPNDVLSKKVRHL